MSTIKVNKEELRQMVREAVARRFATLKEQAVQEQQGIAPAPAAQGPMDSVAPKLEEKKG